MVLCSIIDGTKCKLLGALTEDNNEVTLQDNIETTHLATGALVSTYIVLLNNGDNLTHKNSGLSNRLLTFCAN